MHAWIASALFLAAQLHGQDKDLQSLVPVQVVKEEFTLNFIPYARFITKMEEGSQGPIVHLDDNTQFLLFEPSEQELVMRWQVGDWIGTYPSYHGRFAPSNLLENRTRAPKDYVWGWTSVLPSVGNPKTYPFLRVGVRHLIVDKYVLEVVEDDLEDLETFNSLPVVLDVGRETYYREGDVAYVYTPILVIQEGGYRWVRARLYDTGVANVENSYLSPILKYALDSEKKKIFTYTQEGMLTNDSMQNGMMISLSVNLPSVGVEGKSFPVRLYYEGESLQVQLEGYWDRKFSGEIVQMPTNKGNRIAKIEDGEVFTYLVTEDDTRYALSEKPAWKIGEHLHFQAFEEGELIGGLLMIKEGRKIINLERKESLREVW